MKNNANVDRIHIAEGWHWKDALISVIEPRSPYRAWHAATDIAAGEAFVGVLDTDPPSVLAGVGIVAHFQRESPRTFENRRRSSSGGGRNRHRTAIPILPSRTR